MREWFALVDKFPANGDEIWDDLNFLNDPLAPVSIPDPTTPGFGGPLDGGWAAGSSLSSDLLAAADSLADYDYDEGLQPAPQRREHREEFARWLGAWPAMGSYGWIVDGERSATGHPWLGGFPQTGTQTPSIMHFVEMRSAEGTDHRIQAIGMSFVGTVAVLRGLIDQLWTAIYGDEIEGTGIEQPTSEAGDDIGVIQHAIDSAAGGPAGAYVQKYSGDYFNGEDWRVVVRDALDATIRGLGIPAESPRPDTTFVHLFAALYPNLVFEPTPSGNRGTYEQIVEVGPTVLGELIFPLGQSGFIDANGVPDRNADSLHEIWRDWRFAPMLHVAEDLAADPDGDLDGDEVLDGFEKWYFGSNGPLARDDADSDDLHLLGEFLVGSDPTDADTDDDAILDGAEDPDQDLCTNAKEVGTDPQEGGARNPLNFWDFFDANRDGDVTAGDFFAVLGRFGAEGVAITVEDALSPVPPAPAYHARHDRTSPAPGADPWDTGPPEGAISARDFFAVLAQFEHSCI